MTQLESTIGKRIVAVLPDGSGFVLEDGTIVTFVLLGKEVVL